MPNRGGQPPRNGWREKFFKHLEKTQLVVSACKASGVSRAHVYRVRRDDPEFARRWDDIIEASTEILEQIAVKRAAEGSDTLMIFLLKARRPDVYRENVLHEHDHRHVVDGQVTLLDGRQPVEVEAVKRREAARMLMAGDGQDVIEGTATEEAA